MHDNRNVISRESPKKLLLSLTGHCPFPFLLIGRASRASNITCIKKTFFLSTVVIELKMAGRFKLLLRVSAVHRQMGEADRFDAALFDGSTFPHQ